MLVRFSPVNKNDMNSDIHINHINVRFILYSASFNYIIEKVK